MTFPMVLTRRARARGQSLQRSLAVELTRMTDTPPLDEVLDRIASHRGGRAGREQSVDLERAGS